MSALPAPVCGRMPVAGGKLCACNADTLRIVQSCGSPSEVQKALSRRMVEQTAFSGINRRSTMRRSDRERRVREVQQKKKGHVICPNCSKETDFILRKGEALVWCRRCRKYFRVSLDVIETSKRSSTGKMPEEEEQPE